MGALWRPETPWFALMLRSVVVYVFLMIALRLAGRRELGQMTTFDLVLLLVLANAVQNSINAGDNSLGGGLISATTLLVLNFAVGEATYRWRWFERIVQGRPLTLVRNGKVVLHNMKRERVTMQTKENSCMTCHAIINPLGFTLENFDAVGRYREQDHGKPVDPTGSYRTRDGQAVVLGVF